VPAAEAQAVADLLVAGGIRAIWNFAPVRLRVAPRIIVHNEDLYCSLASLSQKLAQALEFKPCDATGQSTLSAPRSTDLPVRLDLKAPPGRKAAAAAI
jgi:hypothetical protein